MNNGIEQRSTGNKTGHQQVQTNAFMMKLNEIVGEFPPNTDWI